MQFMEDATTLCCFKYCTYMNAVSILDKLCLWLLQKQNVKRDAIEKKIAPSNATNATNATSETNTTNATSETSATNTTSETSAFIPAD